jgi:5-methylthioadenosine/S-adenosylhomocysteine deaminase
MPDSTSNLGKADPYGAAHEGSPVAYRASGLHFLRKTSVVLTALLNKCRYRDPTIFPAWEVLRMATIEGAQAVGLGDEVGSLEAGKQADLILVDLAALNLSPVLEAPVRVPAAGGPAQPGLRRKRARG